MERETRTLEEMRGRLVDAAGELGYGYVDTGDPSETDQIDIILCEREGPVESPEVDEYLVCVAYLIVQREFGVFDGEGRADSYDISHWVSTHDTLEEAFAAADQLFEETT